MIKRMEQFCVSQDGQVGIDLGTSEGGSPLPPTATHIGTGIWDNAARADALQVFLRQAAAVKSCSRITIRTPEGFRDQAKFHVHHFESEIVQSNQEIQLTNSRFRHLNLLPGKYELFVTSMMSGDLLERLSFKVKDQSKPQTVSLSVGKSGEVIPEDPAETD
jgi:hypothetical protein